MKIAHSAALPLLFFSLIFAGCVNKEPQPPMVPVVPAVPEQLSQAEAETHIADMEKVAVKVDSKAILERIREHKDRIDFELAQADGRPVSVNDQHPIRINNHRVTEAILSRYIEQVQTYAQ